LIELPATCTSRKGKVRLSQLISRRSIISSGLKTGLGIVVLRDLAFNPGPVIAFSDESQAQPDRFLPAYKRLDEFIAQHMRETGAPGMTVALATRNGLLRVSQYGFADLKARQFVTPRTLFEIGSISKSFVAVAMLQVAEEGKIDLHKPVTNYLPWLKVDSQYAPFTTHHLLSHTAGLSGVPLLIRVAAGTLRTGSEPGTRFLYSNIGYVLLGFLLEAIDKRPFADVLRKRVLEPLGMNLSEPTITNAIRERLAVGYAPLHQDRPFPLRGKLAEASWIEVPEAAGSVAATSGDMIAYMQMLLNRGVGPRGRVLSEKSFQLLVQPVIKAPFRGEDASYAYGLWVSDANGHQLLRHTGGMVAFSSAMYVDLTAGFAAFASVNANLAGYRPVSVTRYALELLNATASEEELPPIPPPPPAPDKVKNAAEYSGTFISPEGKKLILVARGDQLIMEHNRQSIVLEQSGRDRFIVKHPDLDRFALSFGRDQDIIVEAFHGGDWWTNERYAGPKSFEYPKEWEAYTGRFRSDSPWYGSVRFILRKGRLTFEGDLPLVQIAPGVFRFEGDSGSVDRLAFDTLIDGKATRMNYSGIDFYRTFTP
jgi:D-alanyl-D-alanine carboxypeptidase